jgi:hypothetical protein
MDGFCAVEVNPLGPLQVYPVNEPAAVRLSVEPAQSGLLLEAVVVGRGFTVTDVVTGSDAQLPLLTVRV